MRESTLEELSRKIWNLEGEAERAQERAKGAAFKIKELEEKVSKMIHFLAETK